jgi:hypothetical protein
MISAEKKNSFSKKSKATSWCGMYSGTLMLPICVCMPMTSLMEWFLGYASQKSQVLKPGQKDCSKAIMAPIALERL